jgi:hypothetical protein
MGSFSEAFEENIQLIHNWLCILMIDFHNFCSEIFLVSLKSKLYKQVPVFMRAERLEIKHIGNYYEKTILTLYI